VELKTSDCSIDDEQDKAGRQAGRQTSKQAKQENECQRTRNKCGLVLRGREPRKRNKEIRAKYSTKPRWRVERAWPRGQMGCVDALTD